jgi:hypothetical protein
LAREESLAIFQLCKNVYGDAPMGEWRHLPFPGTLLEQPDWWMHDYFVLEWRMGLRRDALGGIRDPSANRVAGLRK